MKWRMFFYGGLLAHFSIVGCRNQGSVFQSEIPYELERLYSLKPAFKNQPNKGFEKRYVLVTYFHHLDCQTCVNRELANLKRFHQEQEDHLDFLMVAFTGNTFDKLEPDSNLRNLRRVGMVRYPILVEILQGRAGLGSRLCITLIDKNNNCIVLQYFPTSERSYWPKFEKKLHHTLSKGY